MPPASPTANPSPTRHRPIFARTGAGATPPDKVFRNNNNSTAGVYMNVETSRLEMEYRSHTESNNVEAAQSLRYPQRDRRAYYCHLQPCLAEPVCVVLKPAVRLNMAANGNNIAKISSHCDSQTSRQPAGHRFTESACERKVGSGDSRARPTLGQHSLTAGLILPATCIFPAEYVYQRLPTKHISRTKPVDDRKDAIYWQRYILSKAIHIPRPRETQGKGTR
jgi:hypothetical protein